MSDSLRPNIVLVGPAGVGKSTIGRRISTLGSREFVDIGAELTAAYGNVHELGEDKRLEIERQLIADYAPKRNMVIATTPTTLADQENLVAFLAAEVYHLSASTEELAERVTQDGLAMRPELAEADDLNAAIDKLRDERAEMYEKFPTIDTTGLSVEQTIDALRTAGAKITDPSAVTDSGITGGGTDTQTQIFYVVISIAAAIALVLLILVLTF